MRSNAETRLFLILHIGGNDLDTTDLDDIFYQRLVLKLALMTKTFLIRHNIQFVFVCELFTRETPRNVSAGKYTKYKRLFNKLLKGEIKKMNYVCFWKIRGIQETKEDVFTDSVHLGMEGTTRYYRSIRGALLQETFRSIIFLFIFYFPLTMMINLIQFNYSALHLFIVLITLELSFFLFIFIVSSDLTRFAFIYCISKR